MIDCCQAIFLTLSIFDLSLCESSTAKTHWAELDTWALHQNPTNSITTSICTNNSGLLRIIKYYHCITWNHFFDLGIYKVCWKVQAVSDINSSVIGCITVARVGMNLPRQLITPISLHRTFWHIDWLLQLYESGLTPSALRTCPKYISLFFLILHFYLFSFSLDSWHVQL